MSCQLLLFPHFICWLYSVKYKLKTQPPGYSTSANAFLHVSVCFERLFHPSFNRISSINFTLMGSLVNTRSRLVSLMWRSVYLAPCVWLPTQVQSDFAVCQSVRLIPITPSPIRVWMSRRLWKFVTFLSRSALKSFMRVDTWLNECVKCMWADAC